jgi:hypothetical protein
MLIGCLEARSVTATATMAESQEQSGEGAAAPVPTPRSGWRRLLWFVGLWGGSVLLLWLISLVIRWAIVP